MNITPRFLGRGSWLARRDPRVLILVVILYIFTMVQAWDIRLVLPLAAIALAYYSSASIPFHAVKRQWVFALTFFTLVVILNSIITGDRVRGMGITDIHVYFKIPILGTPVSAESLAYAGTQWVRYLAMVTVGFPIAFCIAPTDLGTAFARLGVPEKFAFGLDLTFRFIPSLSVDYRETIDAQRVRGYEPSRRGGPIARLRRMIPVLTPLTISAITGAEDTIDAMDLRAFGTGKRTWLRELRFDRTDWVVLGLFLALFAFVTFGDYFLGTSQLWVPPFMIPG
ncbi:MAG TPA: energy-coupling factor transporter transmembrane component T [Candidatus Limnocylindrales bacterium]|nr:energy-coupling factor transporter transmembrane component T [Candidatus Limnocylindrales bacterium]